MPVNKLAGNPADSPKKIRSKLATVLLSHFFHTTLSVRQYRIFFPTQEVLKSVSPQGISMCTRKEFPTLSTVAQLYQNDKETLLKTLNCKTIYAVYTLI